MKDEIVSFVIISRKFMYVWYGIMDGVVVDNMFFESKVFCNFVSEWEFEVFIFSFRYL